MKVEGVKSVTITYESGDEETYTHPTVSFTRTEVGNPGDKDYRPNICSIDITVNPDNIVEKVQGAAV